MLSFFGHPFIAPAARYRPEPEPSLEALFQLLGGLDNGRAPCHQVQRPQRPQTCGPRNMNVRPRPVSTFTPRFDVRETANAYVLHGDLAGLQRENVRIEFVDPQTLVIRGRVERVHENQPQQTEESAVSTTAPEAPTKETAAPEAIATETAVPEQDKPEEEVEVDWEDVKSTTSSTDSKYHRPTVEDDTDDEDNHSNVSTPKSVTSETKEAAPAPEAKEAEKAAVPQAPAPAPVPAPTHAPDKAANEKVWLSERSVGEFSRAFTFAKRVQQDQVTATLDNGVLSVVVPKAPRHVVRPVFVF